MQVFRNTLMAAAVATVGTGSIAAGASEGSSRTFRFQYEVTVRDIPAGAQRVSVWVPVPKTDRHQFVRDLKIECPFPYRVEKESEYGNSILHLEAKKPLPQDFSIHFTAVVERRAYTSLQGGTDAEAETKPSDRDLRADRLVPLDGVIAKTADEVTKGSATTLEQVRAIYDYVTNQLKYDKSGDGWGRGDALYACDVRRGNCTDFHSLIIGMARSKSIPARFVIGFPLPEDRKEGEIPGYHCWAELYVEGIGWLPVDSSEASKHPEKREALFGGLDANRVEFTTGRDLHLVPEASESLNYFVYPHVEVDGKPYKGFEKRFTFSDVGD